LTSVNHELVLVWDCDPVGRLYSGVFFPPCLLIPFKTKRYEVTQRIVFSSSLFFAPHLVHLRRCLSIMRVFFQFFLPPSLISNGDQAYFVSVCFIYFHLLSNVSSARSGSALRLSGWGGVGKKGKSWRKLKRSSASILPSQFTSSFPTLFYLIPFYIFFFFFSLKKKITIRRNEKKNSPIHKLKKKSFLHISFFYIILGKGKGKGKGKERKTRNKQKKKGYDCVIWVFFCYFSWLFFFLDLWTRVTKSNDRYDVEHNFFFFFFFYF